MELLETKKDIKFEELYDVNDWEIESPHGWTNIEKIGVTVPYNIYEIETSSGKNIKCADEHILYDENNKEKFCKYFNIGSKILTVNGIEEVTKFIIHNKYENMYDVQIGGDHTYWSNGFKSHNTIALVNTAIQLTKSSCNVLYITAEDGENAVIERIDGNQLDMPTDQLPLIKKETYNSKLMALRNNSAGRLIIKEYPTAFANVNHVRALMDELEIKENFKPDFIVLDYLNIFNSIRFKNMGDSYTLVKAVTEEFRGLCVEKDIGIWTATQTNRQGYVSTDLELNDISESWGTATTADFVIAMIENDDFKVQGKYLYKIIKSRYSKIDPRTQKFFMGVDKDKQQIYELKKEDVRVGLVSEDITPAISSGVASGLSTRKNYGQQTGSGIKFN